MKAKHCDIAIIGGGIAGFYCCEVASSERDTILFEATERVGGRIETVSLQGFQAEYGSMRFDPSRQAMTGKLIRELGLDTEPFPEYSSPPVSERETMYNLKDEEKDLNALELFALGIRRVLSKSESDLMVMSEEELDYVRRTGTHNNSPLWAQGLWDILADVLSYDAVKNIIMEGTFFHGIHENPGVAGTMITWVKMLQMSKHLKGIKGGMQNITDKMLEKIRGKGVPVYTGHLLQAIHTSVGGKLVLEFNTGKVIANHVILALPSASLKLIKGIPDNIRALLDTVIEYPLLKCFFVVKDPWWDQNTPNLGAGSFPSRELHYYKQDGKGMVMVYADRPSINLWRPSVDIRPMRTQDSDNNRVLSAAFAKRMHIDIDCVIGSGVRDWTRAPYGAGVHLWKPGIAFWEVSEQLEAFSLTGEPPLNVHICGEAFSDYQGFMEGALRSSRKVLIRVLN